jgi:hypothetical protein
MNRLLFALSLISATLPAATIIDIVAAGQGVGVGAHYAEFSLSSTWTNVAISLELGNAFSTPTANVFLTNQVGTGTLPGLIPAGNEYVASLSFVPVNGDNTVFSGLTLAPGNYFITFEPTGGAVGWIGFGGAPVTQTTGSGVTYLGSNGLNAAAFAPAGTLSTNIRTNNFTVTGDLQVAGIPEPSTFALTLGAAALLYFKSRRQTVNRG